MKDKEPISAKEFWKTKFDEYPQTGADRLAVAMMQEYNIAMQGDFSKEQVYPIPAQPISEEENIWEKLVDSIIAQHGWFNTEQIAESLKKQFTIKRLVQQPASEPEQNKKYSYFKNEAGEYIIIHKDKATGTETFIAEADDAEKADFLCKAANLFNIDKYIEAASEPVEDKGKEDWEKYADYFNNHKTTTVCVGAEFISKEDFITWCHGYKAAIEQNNNSTCACGDIFNENFKGLCPNCVAALQSGSGGEEIYKENEKLKKQLQRIDEAKDFFIKYIKSEHDFQVIQLNGLGISNDQFFEQRINAAIMMAWKAKTVSGSGVWVKASLFVKENIKLHSGQVSDFKIECDALTDEDLDCLAYLVSKNFTFYTVQGIPTGGERFAAKLDKYCDGTAKDLLIVDDVLTTGESMERMRDITFHDNTKGVVIFARGKCPDWVTPIFQLLPNEPEAEGSDTTGDAMENKSSDNKNFEEDKLQKAIYDFAEFTGENYIKMHGGWMKRFADQRDIKNLVTTEEIYLSYLQQLKEPATRIIK